MVWNGEIVSAVNCVGMKSKRTGRQVIDLQLCTSQGQQTSDIAMRTLTSGIRSGDFGSVLYGFPNFQLRQRRPALHLFG